MVDRIKTFGRVDLTVKSTSGLNVEGGENDIIQGSNLISGSGCLPVAGFDDKRRVSVRGSVLDRDENVLWRGSLFDHKSINQGFAPFQGDKSKGIEAARYVVAFHDKTVGVVRLESSDAVNFVLMRCNGGEENGVELARFVDPEILHLMVSVAGEAFKILLFDKVFYKKRLDRLKR